MKKPSTRTSRVGELQDQQLSIGLDLGDRSSFYCVLNGAGEVILEERVTASPEAMKKTFEKMPRSRIALETGILAKHLGDRITVWAPFNMPWAIALWATARVNFRRAEPASLTF